MIRMTRIFVTLLAGVAVLVAGLGVSPATHPASPTPFSFIDVFIDPQGKPLAAYQFELRATAGEVKLVGIEGGEHAAFAKPPYYDTKALLNERIVIAAFNTGAADALPAGRTRVVRLMIHATGDAKPTFDVDLQVAAGVDAKPLDAAVISISEGVAR